MNHPKIVPARSIDSKGRCCGRKPITYKRPPHLFCDRCHASYSPETGKQIPNWAYYKLDSNSFEVRTSAVPSDQRG